MTLSIEALNILMLLLPGLMSGQIFYSFFQTGEVTVPKRLLDALLFSFVTYLLVSTFMPWEPLAQVKLTSGRPDYLVTGNAKIIWFSFAIILLVPIAVGFLYHTDLIHTVLRKCKITTKTSRKNTWNDAFLTQDRYVIVSLKDGRRIRGYPTMFSTDPEEGFVYLYNPAWVNDDKENDNDPNYFESNCHGFLLNRDNIELIEFTLNPGENLSVKP
ncbi:MAG: hypothetical protein C4575_06615 [Desulforudis sp.]|jgi:hypothetical protein|nr:MAG: hypothetical protein C4575_06615 [Desulforudis sp.]